MIRTSLYAFLEGAGGKFVDFSGYELPLQFAGKGFIKEHLHCRSKAALFDVSHMGQFRIRDSGNSLVSAFPVDPSSLDVGQTRYTQLLNEHGGTVDDLMVANDGDSYFIVFNASRKDVAVKALAERASGIEIEPLDNALVALQGPSAESVLCTVLPEAADLRFMQAVWMKFEGGDCRVSRSGYTGEDGYEISLPSGLALGFCERLALHPDFDLAGLGARDSLRLEAGLCLYGHELNEEITPVEAGLTWSVPKGRREKGAFVGSDRVVEQIENGADRKLVGLTVDGRTPVRQGASLLCGDQLAGDVVSGVFSPSLGHPVATAFVSSELAAPETVLHAEVRGKRIECRTARLPFVKHNYRK